MKNLMNFPEKRKKKNIHGFLIRKVNHLIPLQAKINLKLCQKVASWDLSTPLTNPINIYNAFDIGLAGISKF